MPSKWIGWIYKGRGGTGWSPREKAHRRDAHELSCNVRRLEYDMWSHAKFSTEPRKEDGPSCVWRVKTTPSDHRGKTICNHCVLR